MPRISITSAMRATVNAQASDDVIMAFIEITHPSLSDSIRVVNDTKNFTYGGATWIGFPFDIVILTDDENPPTASLAIQNIDQDIGEAIQSCRTPPRLHLFLLHSDDFNLAVTPRAPIGTPAVEYSASKLFLANVKIDPLQIEAEIVGWDYLQRTWPGIRATQNRLPGLFR